MKTPLLASAIFIALMASAAAMDLRSADIRNGAPIPNRQVNTSCGGANVSPQLSWSGAPAGTKSFVLTAIDLDVRPAEFTHWIVAGIPPHVSAVAKGASPAGGTALRNSFGDARYDGPCPPPGSDGHRYRFTVWAMGPRDVQFAPNASAMEIATLLEKTALAQASITGTYRR